MPHESNSLLLKMSKVYYEENGKEKKKKQREKRGWGEGRSWQREGGWLVGWLRKWNSVTVKASALY